MRSMYVDHERQALDFEEGSSRTKQSEREECDANKIMAKWHRSGLVTHLNATPPRYGDFDNAGDYLSAQNAVIQADREFDALSSEVRARMQNSPANFMRFMADPSNLDEAIALGLATKPAAIASPAPPAVPPPAAPPAVEPEPEPAPISGGD